MSFTTIFSQDIKSIIVKFTCKQCGNKIESEEIIVPYPNNTAEKTSDSYNKNDGIALCHICKTDYDVDVYSGSTDGYIEIFDIDDNSISYEEIVDEKVFKDYMNQQIDSIVNSHNYIDQFEKEIENLKKLSSIRINDNELKKTLLKQIYSGSITCLEDYLSNTLIKSVLGNENNFKNFVITYKKFKDRKFELTEIYTKVDSLEDIIKQELLDIIYHDLRKVRGIFQDTLKIEFPEIKDLMMIIMTRHDIVHRNGKNKNGDEIEISERMVSDVIEKVYVFIKKIEARIDAKIWADIDF